MWTLFWQQSKSFCICAPSQKSRAALLAGPRTWGFQLFRRFFIFPNLYILAWQLPGILILQQKHTSNVLRDSLHMYLSRSEKEDGRNTAEIERTHHFLRFSFIIWMYSTDLLKLLDLFPKVAKSSWKPYSIQYCSNLPFGFDSDGFYLLHLKNLAPDMFSVNSQEKNQLFCPQFLLWGSPATAPHPGAALA